MQEGILRQLPRLSTRLPGPRGSAGVQRAAFQIVAGALAGTSGSGIHAAVERSKYVRQAMALYEAQTYEPQKAAHLQPHEIGRAPRREPGHSTNTVQAEYFVSRPVPLTRLPGPRGSAGVRRAAYAVCRRRRRRHQRIRDPCRGRAKRIRQAGDGAIRSANLRATESGSPPAAWIPDIPPRRTLPIHQNSAGGIPGKRGEESQEEFTSSVAPSINTFARTAR